ncbi:MAG: class I SAM-dependent methyltransferase [Candidatus Hydrogenedentes bacterium]|nr:class I SAM-dependent methyltransferase [Candidatus Hydrogenedentota bacterium]
MEDEVAVANRRLWEEEVRKGCGYTVPWLDIDVSLLRRFAEGKLSILPEPMTGIFPFSILADVEGKDVLCLAAGGGQQSAVFSLMGARVTVVDLAEGQLEGDRKAAQHYGYHVTTCHADMRDLSCLNDDSFDLVFQANSMAYVPDVRVVYSEVARVLRRGGIYRVDCSNPANTFVKWNGAAYSITAPYSETTLRREDGGIEFRHYIDDVFNGLLDSGFSIQRVHEEVFSRQTDCGAVAGSWHHERAYVAGGFIIIARKEKKPF